MENLSNEQLAVILGTLKVHIVGQTCPSFSCSCGCIQRPQSTAVTIVPHAKYWGLWQVDMGTYSRGISDFVSDSELHELFGRGPWDPLNTNAIV